MLFSKLNLKYIKHSVYCNLEQINILFNLVKYYKYFTLDIRRKPKNLLTDILSYAPMVITIKPKPYFLKC